jgi:hypothetical protein
MKPEDSTSRSQSGFFSESGELGGAHPQFAELCTALYEREVTTLSVSAINNLSLIKRRIGGLPHHVRSVARFMVAVRHNDVVFPLDIDTHNGSWYAKQSAKCPGNKHDKQKCAQWYAQHGAYGLVVPVLMSSMEGFTIELDSIDMVDHTLHRVHLNKHGWFLNSGASAEGSEKIGLSRCLLKPSKAIMTSACCGHSWTHKSRTFPRALSIREMRLSTQINWKNFTLPPPQKE